MSSEALRLADELPSIDNLKRIVASDSPTAIQNGLVNAIKWIQSLERELKFERAASFRDQIASLEAERDQLRAERDTLSRWKSTNAPRIEALQGLKDHAQSEAEKGSEAIASLASERNANAILTSEVEALRAEVERLRPNALRYEFLRDTSQICGSMTGRGVAMPSYETTPQQRSYLDECIDRAIEAAKEAK